jgi:hypothetical protein
MFWREKPQDDGHGKDDNLNFFAEQKTLRISFRPEEEKARKSVPNYSPKEKNTRNFVRNRSATEKRYADHIISTRKPLPSPLPPPILKS